MHELGKIIISAFDNYGGVSYPAAFDCVLGVDVDPKCNKRRDYRFYENNIINIGIRDGVFRVADLKKEFTLKKGSSFGTALFCGMISKKIFENRVLDDKWNFIRMNAYDIKHCYKSELTMNKVPFNINRASIFPYNKEMHSLINFREILPFEIVHVCDIKYKGLINKEIVDLQKRPVSIQSIFDNVYEDVDTIIVGQLHDIIALVGDEFLKQLAENIKKNRLNIYMFDESLLPFLEDYPCGKRYKVQNINYIRNNNKLFFIEKPVLGIMGTSSVQGKFTLQLEARKYFLDLGYRVGQMGTEPTAYLFGFDYQYVYGYGICEEDIGTSENTISKLNKVMHEIDQKDIDIIITGSQSGTVPLAYNNIGQLPLRQQEFLLGVSPDIVILCVNLFDELFYIERTIKYIESLTGASVVALAINPMIFRNDWLYSNGIREMASKETVAEFSSILEDYFNIKICILGDNVSVKSVFDYILEELSKG